MPPNDPTTQALITMSKEIGGLTQAVKDQGREIGQLREMIEKVQTDRDTSCGSCKTEIDARLDDHEGRLDTIEKKHECEVAVTSWFDSTVGRAAAILGVAVACIGVVTALVTFFAWVFPIIQKVM
jgi:hypothetical protein